MTFLLDTNVLSELRKPAAGNCVADWVDAQDELDLYVSVISFAEVRRGISLLEMGRKRASLNEWLEKDLIGRFGRRIYEVDLEISLAWGDLVCDARRQGRTLSSMDGLIAATARVKSATLAARNTKDFQSLGLTLVDPWQA